MARWLLVLAVATLATLNLHAQDKEAKPLFELRVYTAAEGKLPVIASFFEKTVHPLYEKNGVKPLGYFTSMNPKEPKFVALLQHADKKTRDAKFAAVRGDEAFKTAIAEISKDGSPIAKSEEFFMTETDYTVAPTKADSERVFELRMYTTTPNNLKYLDARFRDHTRKLFEKYGMTNLWYFHLTQDSKDADNTMIYFLAHKSEEARNKSFDQFRVDPAWVAARDASEKLGGGSLTTKDGVKGLMLKATSFSPLK